MAGLTKQCDRKRPCGRCTALGLVSVVSLNITDAYRPGLACMRSMTHGTSK